MTEFLDSNLVKVIGLIASIIGIIGVGAWLRYRKTKVKNRLVNTKVHGDFVGMKSKSYSKSESDIENEILNTTIKGNYTGSEES